LTAEAFAERIVALVPALLAYAHHTICQYSRDHVPPDIPADALAEATRRALGSLQRYNDHNGDAGLTAWLKRILRRTCYDFARNERVRSEGNARLAEHLRSLPHKNPLEQKLQRIAIKQEMPRAGLTAGEQTVVEHVLQDEEDADIAAATEAQRHRERQKRNSKRCR
jgi:DNA-directed RNA polymerase specialized sigma24 family protein